MDVSTVPSASVMKSQASVWGHREPAGIALAHRQGRASFGFEEGNPLLVGHLGTDARDRHDSSAVEHQKRRKRLQRHQRQTSCSLQGRGCLRCGSAGPRGSGAIATNRQSQHRRTHRMLTTPHFRSFAGYLSHRLWPTMEQHLSPHCLSQHMAATEQMIQLLPQESHGWTVRWASTSEATSAEDLVGEAPQQLQR